MVDTTTAVWVSTPEKFSKIVLGKTRNFSRKFRGVSAPALDKNPAVTDASGGSTGKKPVLARLFLGNATEFPEIITTAGAKFWGEIAASTGHFSGSEKSPLTSRLKSQ